MVKNIKKRAPPPVPKKPAHLRAPPKAELGRLAVALRTMGGLGGRLMYGDHGAAVGEGLGASISRWLGAGDYSVSSNSITQRVNSGSPAIPMMHNSGQSIIVRHKEYITDIISSPTANTFQISPPMALNPGLSSSFPWLANIAQQYQEYTWKGIVFHFESTSGDSVGSVTTSLGTVMMATQYRSTAAPYTNKQNMLNDYFSCDGKPSVSFVHPIECDPKENPYNVQYVRGGAVPEGEDAKTYDIGAFYHATTGMQGVNVNLGELWVTYEVELRKPIITGSQGLYVESAHYTGLTASSGSPFGTTRTALFDNIGIVVTPAAMSFPIGVVGTYMFTFWWASLYTANTQYAITPINCSVSLGQFGNTTGAAFTAGGPQQSFVVTVTDPSKIATIALTGGLLLGSGSVDFRISQVSSAFV